MSESDKIIEITQALAELASGNYDVQLNPPEISNEWHAITTGINMLKEELQHSVATTNYLERIYDGMIDMMLVTNLDHQIQKVNKSTIKRLGFLESFIIGKNINEVFAKPEAFNKESFNKELKDNGHLNINIELKTKKGKRNIPVSCSVSMLYDRKNNPKSILYVAKDISDLLKVKKELLTKKQEFDTFIYKAAHDLKGPLSTIAGITNIAKIEIKDSAPLRYFELIRACADKLDKILYNLRQIASIEKTYDDRQCVNMKEFIDMVISNILEKYKNIEKPIQFNIKVKQKDEFYTSPKMLYNIIFNLVDNAVKYRKFKTSEPCMVDIKAQSTSKGIKLIVEDNGIGIRQEFQGKVFDLFYKASSISDGTGLGLYIVKSNIKSLKGKISLESSENEGTTIIVRIPSLKENNHSLL